MTAMNIFGWVLCGLGLLVVLVCLVAIITISCMKRSEKSEPEKKPENESEKTEPEKKPETEPEKKPETEPEKKPENESETESETEPEKKPENEPEIETETEKKPHKEWQTQSLDLDPGPEKKPEPKPNLSADDVRAIAQAEIAKEEKAALHAERKNYLTNKVAEAEADLDECDALIKDVEAEISRVVEAANSFKENQARFANRRRLMARVNAFDGSQTAKANQALYGPMKSKEGLDAANAAVDAKKAEEEATLGNFQEQDDLFDEIKNPDEAYYNRLVEILERLYEDRAVLQETYKSYVEELNKLPA